MVEQELAICGLAIHLVQHKITARPRRFVVVNKNIGTPHNDIINCTSEAIMHGIIQYNKKELEYLSMQCSNCNDMLYKCWMEAAHSNVVVRNIINFK